MSRRIALFTATRAEYGLLRPVARALRAQGGLEPLWLVGGAHLSAALGGTVSEIEADGEPVAARLEGTAPASDSPAAVAEAAARTAATVTDALTALQPDALIVLGDRTELLGAATAAVILGVPLIHLEGGHITEGAVDDRVRHAVSKLADLHFTAHPAYRDRLLQLGEPPERVFAVGSTGVDDLHAAGPTDLAAASAALDWPLEPGVILVAWHPETLSDRDPGADARAVLDGVLAAAGDRRLVLTGPNADVGREAVQAELERVAVAHPDRVRLYASLGRARWGKVLGAADALVGNSSAGVIEAPALGVPSVNAGDRQAGRLRLPGVIDCAPTAEAVAAALRQALDPAFRAGLTPDPLADGQAASRIAATLAAVDFSGLARKPFIDRP
ncbi:MAG: UDP-N-acetylglucosamine 2-epimerase [Brevundimonas sp.]|uniref:UDP-N-acetylglucosamine 2-epimerase n=1 Tax=Brevundimonas sp. TaxID=1871086 RepID=UPI00391F6054